ncbi:MAG: M48 family metallopeptidase [Smithellaceae bacterium]|nr:M48 family metallopeptidase [Smithellaceae bacterium]
MIQINALLIFFLSAFIGTALLRWLLKQLNSSHLKKFGNQVPEALTGEIDETQLGKIRDYAVESSRFDTVESLVGDALTLAAVLSGILPWLLGLILSWNLSFVLSGLIFFGALALVSILLGLPFDLYGTFVIEKKYGFSTITLKLWLADLAKGLMVSVIILGALLTAFLALLDHAPHLWWFLSWLIFASFQLVMIWLYPIIIAPLFNKYDPVQDEELRNEIVAMMAEVGLKTEGVYQMDAAKRSRHTNAYFTGLGKTKRIVLFDTLLSSHSREEILSVLAHEIGHWRKKHVLRQLLFIEVLSLVVLYLAYRLIDWPLLYATFGFTQQIPYVGILLLVAVFGPLSFFVAPLASKAIRRFEREADAFAADLGRAAPLRLALIRLAKDNLSNLHPHPLYAWFYYTHPPLTERIAYLERLEKAKAP